LLSGEDDANAGSEDDFYDADYYDEDGVGGATGGSDGATTGGDNAGDGGGAGDGSDSGASKPNMCEGLSPVDLLSAGKANVVEYDTGVKGSENHHKFVAFSVLTVVFVFFCQLVEMVVPSDQSQAKCGGVIDAARSSSGQTSEVIHSTVKEMMLSLLESSSIGETTIIERGPITIMTTKYYEMNQIIHFLTSIVL